MLTAEQIDEVSAAEKDGFIDKMGIRARAGMHKKFVKFVKPESLTILDVGASSSPALRMSNFLEFAYPNLNITAVGLGEETEVWKKLYPKVPYIKGCALNLPFENNSFDVVYSHAVIEHVGNFENQTRMIKEAIRVARKSVWITTPNRWHPLEFHTILPLIHWLPKKIHRQLLSKLGREYFSNEKVLNLMSEKELYKAIKLQSRYAFMTFKIHRSRFMGFTENLLLHIKIR
jgi:2-polyprenyl-3-methyl-5-hydroxy-6-metoxy-1,4-benzoquinol methylase